MLDLDSPLDEMVQVMHHDIATLRAGMGQTVGSGRARDEQTAEIRSQLAVAERRSAPGRLAARHPNGAGRWFAVILPRPMMVLR